MKEDERLFRLANDIAMGRGVTQDYVKAARLCKEAAAMGNLRAKFVIIASSYEPFQPRRSSDETVEEEIPFRYLNYTNLFPSVEKEEAMKTLKECAEAGIPEAQYLMARNGPDNEREGWMTKAAQNGSVPAIRRMLESTEGDEKEKWLMALSLALSVRDRKMRSTDGTITPEYADWLINAPDDLEVEENRKYYRIAAKAGYAEAQVKLAKTYDYTEPEFLYWIHKAADQNNCNACEELMEYHASDQSPAEWFYWMKRGADQGDPYLRKCIAEYCEREMDSKHHKNPYYNPAAARIYSVRAAAHGSMNIKKKRKERGDNI